MTTITSAAGALEWPKEVAEFAAEQGVEHCLPAILEMTRGLFPAAQRLEVLLEADWEIANQWYIVFEVEVSGWDVSRAVAARHQWILELGRCCPSARPGPFVLGLELVK
jgi:hypothetical protein